MIMNAIVAPRNTSRETNRSEGTDFSAGAGTANVADDDWGISFLAPRYRVPTSRTLRLRVQRVLTLLVKFVLQLEADFIRLHGADCLDHGVDPPIHLELTQFLRCRRAFAGIMIREACVPPD